MEEYLNRVKQRNTNFTETLNKVLKRSTEPQIPKSNNLMDVITSKLGVNNIQTPTIPQVTQRNNRPNPTFKDVGAIGLELSGVAPIARTVKFAKETFNQTKLGQAIGSALDNTVIGRVRDARNKLDKTKVGSFLMGVDEGEDVKSLQERLKIKTDEPPKEYQTRVGKMLHSQPVAALGIVLGEGLNLIPGFGAEKNVLKSALGSNVKKIISEGVDIVDDVNAIKYVKNLGFSDDVARVAGPQISLAKTPQEVESVLKNTIAHESQVLTQKATAELETLKAKASGVPSVDPATGMNIPAFTGILSHDEMARMKLLQKNINNPLELMNIYKEPKSSLLYHGTPTGKYSVDNIGNINFGTVKDDIAKFAGSDGKVHTIDMNDYNIKTFETKEEMFAAANENRDIHLKEGVDIVGAENHYIAINPEKISQKTGIGLEKPFRQKTIGELQAEYDKKKEVPQLKNKLFTTLAKSESGMEISNTLRKAGFNPTEQNILDIKNAKTADEVSDIIKNIPVETNKMSKITTFYNNMRKFVDDSRQAVKNMTREKGYKKTGELNTYEMGSIYEQRMRAKITEVSNEGEEILKNINKEKIPNFHDDADSYAKYLHAIEYNKFHGDLASGVSTSSATKEIDRLKALPHFDKIEEAQKKLIDFNKKILNNVYEAGLISKESYDDISSTYSNYVNFARVMDETKDVGNIGMTAISDVRDSGVLKRKGSAREVKNVFQNSIENAIRLTNKAERNIYDSFVAKEVRANPQMGKVVSADDFKTVEKASDMNVIPFMEKGKKKLIVFNDDELARAISGANLEDVGTAAHVIKTIGGLTRIFNNLLTRFNFGFMVANPIRDAQEMMVYLDSLNIGKNVVSKTALKIPTSQKEIFNHVYRGKKSEEYTELLRLGGAPGGQALSLVDNIDPTKVGKAGFFKAVIKQFDNVNEILENATRLSVFKQLKKAGVNAERAAYIANEATINYSRRGTSGNMLASLYSFAKVNISANVKFLRAMKNPKTAAKVIATVFGASYAASKLNEAINPNWKESVPEKTRDTNLIIVYGNKENGEPKYFKIPVAQSLRPIFIASNSVNGDEPQKGNITEKIAKSLFEMFNPIGGSIDNPISMVTPTIGRPLVEIGQNKSWTGKNIKPDTYGKNVPESERYYDSLQEGMMGRGEISLTEALAKGGIELSPADIDYFIKQMSGGLGKSVIDSVESTSKAINGEEVDVSKIPVLSRFFGVGDSEKTPSPVDKKVLEMQKEQERKNAQINREARNLYKEYKKLPPKEAVSKALDLKKTNPRLFENLKDVIIEEKKGLTKNDKAIMQLQVSNGQRAHYIYEEIMSLPKEKRYEKYKEYREKKIISDEVKKQILWLAKNK